MKKKKEEGGNGGRKGRRRGEERSWWLSLKRRMNVFRLGGDLSHVIAISLLLLKMMTSKSCAGEEERVFGWIVDKGG